MKSVESVKLTVGLQMHFGIILSLLLVNKSLKEIKIIAYFDIFFLNTHNGTYLLARQEPLSLWRSAC